MDRYFSMYLHICLDTFFYVLTYMPGYFFNVLTHMPGYFSAAIEAYGDIAELIVSGRPSLYNTA